jgi:hypothetical protein
MVNIFWSAMLRGTGFSTKEDYILKFLMLLIVPKGVSKSDVSRVYFPFFRSVSILKDSLS